MSFSRRIALFSCLAATACALRAAPAEKPPETPQTRDFFGPGTTTAELTLSAAVEAALRQNLEVQFERVGVKAEQARTRFAAGAFDPVFSVSYSHASALTPDDRNNVSSAESVAQLNALETQIAAINQNTLANQQFVNAIERALGRPVTTFNTPPLTATSGTNSVLVFDQDVDRAEAAISGRSPLGTRFAFSTRASRTRTTYEGDTREIIPIYSAFAGLEIRQPLLKDFGPSANLAELRIARKTRDIQELTLGFRIENTLQQVLADYYELVYGFEDLRIKGDAISAGLRLLAHNQRRQELGFFSPFEVQQARVQVSFDRENLLLSKNFFLDRQFTLKRLILSEHEGTDRRVFLPVLLPPLAIPNLNRDALLAEAFAKRLDYKVALTQAESQDIRLKFAQNQTWPQLDVIASYGWNGLDRKLGAAYDRLGESQGPSWQLGVQGSVPLGNVQPRAQLDAAKAYKEQAILRVKSAELEVSLSVDRAIALIQTNRDRLAMTRFTTQAGEEAVRVGYRRMEEGLISNFDLIEQQRRLYEARSREHAAQAELNKSITQLWLATGTVQERLRITPVDAPAEAKKVVEMAKPSRATSGPKK